MLTPVLSGLPGTRGTVTAQRELGAKPHPSLGRAPMTEEWRVNPRHLRGHLGGQGAWCPPNVLTTPLPPV